ncbi:hypothetical protein [Haloarcula sp. H-GB4]|uniref:hypothetical protein n=1 Tax=Haloarcula sp. H-GB4 TaxID=3069755 RepID=UPI00359C204D
MSRSEPGTPFPDVTGLLKSAIRTGIAVCFAEGIRRRSPGAVVNALIAFGGASLPDILERRCAVEFRPWQRIYVETAMLTHAVGMLGPYDDIWWWDNLTHIHSATVLGGLIHVLSRRLGVDPEQRVITGVATMGILWEFMEYIIHASSRRLGLEPILVSYGKTDTLLDLVSDLVGAVLVLVFGDVLLGNLVRRENG